MALKMTLDMPPEVATAWRLVAQQPGIYHRMAAFVIAEDEGAKFPLGSALDEAVALRDDPDFMNLDRMENAGQVLGYQPALHVLEERALTARKVACVLFFDRGVSPALVTPAVHELTSAGREVEKAVAALALAAAQAEAAPLVLPITGAEETTHSDVA